MGQHAAAQGTVRELRHSQGAPLSPVHDARMYEFTDSSCCESVQFLQIFCEESNNKIACTSEPIHENCVVTYLGLYF